MAAAKFQQFIAFVKTP